MFLPLLARTMCQGHGVHDRCTEWREEVHSFHLTCVADSAILFQARAASSVVSLSAADSFVPSSWLAYPARVLTFRTAFSSFRLTKYMPHRAMKSVFHDLKITDSSQRS
jgi:hypothetical protein